MIEKKEKWGLIWIQEEGFLFQMNLEKKQIETTIFTPSNDDVGVFALSEQEVSMLTLRLYQLTRFDDGPDYHPVQ